MSAFTQSNFPTQQSSAGASSGSATQQEAHGATVPSTYTIGGVRVEFPAKAYPSQLAMMNKVSLSTGFNKSIVINMLQILNGRYGSVYRIRQQLYMWLSR